MSEREREGKRQLPPEEIRKGKNVNQWSVSQQCKERVGLSSFVNTTTASVFWFVLFIENRVLESIDSPSTCTQTIFLGNFFIRSLIGSEEENKKGDLLPVGSTHVWTCFQRLDLISGWSFFFVLLLSSLCTQIFRVCVIFSFHFHLQEKNRFFLSFILDNDISNSIIIIIKPWIIFLPMLMIQGKTNSSKRRSSYLHLMSKGISSILCIHKSRHRLLSVVVPVQGANPSISFRFLFSLSTVSIYTEKKDLVSFEIELT